MLACTTWQDDYVGSRVAELFLGRLNPATTWFVGNNGLHTQCATPQNLLVQFFDHFVKGLNNGFEMTAHVILAHEVSTIDPAQRSPALNYSGAPAWTTTLSSWTDGVLPLVLHLQGNGGLLPMVSAPATGPPVSYQYPTNTVNTSSTWNGTPTPNGRVSFTTAALASDLEVLGPANAGLWIDSSAIDTDLQVTVSEVRPDGRRCMSKTAGCACLSER